MFVGTNNNYNNNFVGIIIIKITILRESLTTKMYHPTHFNQILVLIYNATLYYVSTYCQQ